MKTPTKKAKKTIYDTDKFGDIQCMNTEVLCMVARGEVDLNQIAINELASRGLDENGKWIGFDKAEEKFIES